jgi:hypothetical protein
MANSSLRPASGTLNLAMVSSKSLQKAASVCGRSHAKWIVAVTIAWAGTGYMSIIGMPLDAGESIVPFSGPAGPGASTEVWTGA